MVTAFAELLTEKRRRAGQLGGLQTCLRYGRDYMVSVGRLGGRPRLPTLEELRQQTAGARNYFEGGRLPNGNSLQELKRLYRLQYEGGA